MIANVTFNYKDGDKIPKIEYTKDEIKTWDAVYSKVFELLPGRASMMHRKYLAVMEAECGYGLGKIPQLEDVSNFLKSKYSLFELYITSFQCAQCAPSNLDWIIGNR